MPKKCAVYAEEVLIMIKPHLMAYGIILMAQLELGLYHLMDRLVTGQATMALQVVPGAKKMATQHLVTGLILTIKSQVNGSRPLKIHTPDIWL